MDGSGPVLYYSEAVLPVNNIIDLMPYLEGAKMGFSVDDIHAALNNERRLQVARESMAQDEHHRAMMFGKIMDTAKHLT